jgi:hypothetical protein
MAGATARHDATVTHLPGVAHGILDVEMDLPASSRQSTASWSTTSSR